MQTKQAFQLQTEFQPSGDQPTAIQALCDSIQQGKQHQLLLGVTGSGKTFTIANVIAKLQRPTIIMAHNKTLAAQLYSEFKSFFPNNAVEYFVSYYDYYQPEAYVPRTDTYIEKEATINEQIDRMRHSATRAMLERKDVIVVASSLGLDPVEVHGIHEVQVGDLEDRSDADAIAQFDAVYDEWQRGVLDVPMPGGETGLEVLDRYLPVLTHLRVRYLDDHEWAGDILVVSHGAAIRLVAAQMAGVDADFASEHHLANGECVVLSPITDGRWSCVQWGPVLPPFYPGHDPEAPVAADPMG